MSTEKTMDAEQLSEKEIDDLVASEADQESAWEPPITVRPSDTTSFAISAELAARAAFLARIHHVRGGVEKWLAKIIRERVELEESAFAEAKRDLAHRSGESFSR